MKRVLDEVMVPDFSRYIRRPFNANCKVVDAGRFILEFADTELSLSNTILSIKGRYGLILRYRREKDEKGVPPRPAYIMSFDERDDGSVDVTQYQQLHDKHVASRVSASFDCSAFFGDILNSLIQNGRTIHMTEFDEDESEGSGFQIGARQRYALLYNRVHKR